jgi:hypothetical protein
MAIDLDNWLAMKKVMEEENHVLMLLEKTPNEQQQIPQLLMLSAHVAKGSSSAATFSVLALIRGKRGITLVGSGSTDTFMDHAFASTLNCSIHSTNSRKVKVARGGYLNTNALISSMPYAIWGVTFKNDFNLL